MFEGYFKVAGLDEARRVVALDCAVKAIAEEPKRLVGDEDWLVKRIVKKARVFENYLKG